MFKVAILFTGLCLSNIEGMTKRQVINWMSNTRKRRVVPLIRYYLPLPPFNSVPDLTNDVVNIVLSQLQIPRNKTDRAFIGAISVKQLIHVLFSVINIAYR